MNERDHFLKALAANEDDTATRMLFAEWLDEQGEHEEADRQRKWPAAKAWLMKLSEDNKPTLRPDYGTSFYEFQMRSWLSYDQLIEWGREWLDEGKGVELYCHCGDSEWLCDELRISGELFWAHWSTVTGVALPPDLVAKSIYKCSC